MLFSKNLLLFPSTPIRCLFQQPLLHLSQLSNEWLSRFQRLETHSEHVTTLSAPAYEVQHEHKFPAEGKIEGPRVSPPKEIQYPVIPDFRKLVLAIVSLVTCIRLLKSSGKQWIIAKGRDLFVLKVFLLYYNIKECFEPCRRIV